MGSEFGITADTKAELRLDAVGIFWMTLGVVWTFMVVGGVAFLHANRDVPLVRIRGLPLSIVAVVLLHMYWLTIQFSYTIGPLIPEEVEFWVMSTWLPFGIALFQVSNSQFLHVARAQKKYLSPKGVASARAAIANLPSRKTLWGRFRRMDYPRRMFVCVVAGMCFQLFLTVFMYLISRKFHSTFGIPGTEVTGTPMEVKVQQGRGWEWWPSLFWQFLWAWVIAPIILWQARGIHDTLGWRLQTIGCCLAGLPASPMWLVALYVPEMAPVNNVFIPPQWFSVSTMMLEIFTIFVPCWQVLRHRSLRQETLEAIAAWESKNKIHGTHGGSVFSDSTRATGKSKGADTWKSLSSMERGSTSEGSHYGGILTMEALESVLERNPEPLRAFSALRDFSGENIAFLTAVAEWKSTLHTSGRANGSSSSNSSEQGDDRSSNSSLSHDVVRERFNRALRIYVDFVSPRDAEFSINIACSDLKRLEAIFEKAARILYGDRDTGNQVAPFAGFDGPPEPQVPSSPTSTSSSTRPLEKASSIEDFADRVQYWGEIPEEFNASVFDEAETSIKYLVLTNTWPKFVKERRYSMDSLDSDFSVDSHDSTSTFTKAVRYLRSMKSSISTHG